MFAANIACTCQSALISLNTQPRALHRRNVVGNGHASADDLRLPHQDQFIEPQKWRRMKPYYVPCKVIAHTYTPARPSDSTKHTMTKKIVDVGTGSQVAAFFECGDIKRAKCAGSNTAEQQSV